MTDVFVHREFVPGTTGWSVDDLDDPAVEALWSSGRYEIVEGVLTKMPPAYYDGSFALKKLIKLLDKHLETRDPDGEMVLEVDLVLSKRRLPVVDAIYLSPEDRIKAKEANATRGRRKLKYGRILVPPTLIIESLSLGHESHDRETKRRWYAEAGVPNYWLLDAQQSSLECLILEGGEYRVDVSGQNDATLRPAMFPGLIIPLAKIWAQ
jgi:Uma2 family endonuclease